MAAGSGVGSGSVSFGEGVGFPFSTSGTEVDSCGMEKEPVSIQVSCPEGFLTGRLKNQTSPPMSRI